MSLLGPRLRRLWSWPLPERAHLNGQVNATAEQYRPPTSFRCRIVRRRLLAQEINGFADTGIAKFDARNNNAIELIADAGAITAIAGDHVLDRPRTWPVLANGLFPTVLHLPHGAAACLVVALNAILIFG